MNFQGFEVVFSSFPLKKTVILIRSVLWHESASVIEGGGGGEGEWARGSAYPTSLTVEEVTIYIDESRLPI